MTQTLDGKKLQEIERAERHIEQAIAKIRAAQERIEEHEEEIREVERGIFSHLKEKPIRTLLRGGLTMHEVSYLQRILLRRLKKKRLFFSIVVIMAAVLVWRGIWELSAMIPVLSSPLVALVVGVLLFWVLDQYSSRR